MASSKGEAVGLGIAAAAAVAGVARAQTVDDLLAGIRHEDPAVRTEAWLGAGVVGAAAVAPLAGVMGDGDLEVARAAKRGLWQVVRYTGRPGADAARQAVVAEMVALLVDGQPEDVRREVLWMLSEIAGDDAVGPVAALLSHEVLREDARMVLERIPGDASLAALQAGLDAAPDDFKVHMAQSLRARGVEVPGLPCQKLVPTGQTNIKPYRGEDAAASEAKKVGE